MAAKNLIVGAIDLGTANSGWAFSFLHDFQKDPTKASVSVWCSGGKLVAMKTPTCVLIEPDGKTIKAFGYDAENVYGQLKKDGEDEGYYYFERFKMMLNKKLGDKLDRKITIEDERGQLLAASNVFAISIRFLVDDMMRKFNVIPGYIGISDVHWVLTVPAIWTAASKQFMREAALEAGIPTSNLTIALESEAALKFGRNLSVDKAVSGGTVAISDMSRGTRYMVLDAGGGAIYITLHEIVSADCVQEIQAPSGGSWGGGLVDKAFENLLIDLIGPTVYGIYKRREPEDWLDLCREFVVKKGAISPDKQGPFQLRFPVSFIDTVKKELRKEFSDVIEASKYADDIKLSGYKIRISASLFKSFFEESIQKTVGHIKSLLRDEKVGDVKAILMVGGYSESPMLQRAIKKEFPFMDVIIPLEASSAILKGAVIYGHSIVGMQ